MRREAHLTPHHTLLRYFRIGGGPHASPIRLKISRASPAAGGSALFKQYLYKNNQTDKLETGQSVCLPVSAPVPEMALAGMAVQTGYERRFRSLGYPIA
jgi:hypothetical protein